MSTSEPRRPGYSAIARVLHWLVAGGIVLQFLLGERAEEAADAGHLQLQLVSLAQHKSIGITVLALAVLRILWRLLVPPPPLPASYTLAQPKLARLSQLTHVALYALLFLLPVSGWLMSSASAYTVSWFNLLTLPDLIAPDESAKASLQSAHQLAAKVLLALAVLHIGAAFKHLLIDKNEVMGRMANTATVTLFALTVAAGVALTWPSDGATERVAGQSASLPQSASGEEFSANIEASPNAETEAAAIPAWRVNPELSHIRFTAQQAGAEFSGQWQQFSADIRFDARNLAQSSATVRIDATSVSTQDAERDSTLAGADWFDSGSFAEIVFRANVFERLAEDSQTFSTKATLTIRGASYPVDFRFSLDASDNSRTLQGKARLDRLALKLGTVEWTDTDWVGQHVDVEVLVVAAVP